MIKVLKIDSSILGEKSLTRELTEMACDNIKAKFDKIELTELDLTKDPFPHFTLDALQVFSDPSKHSDSEILTKSNKAIEQLINADIIIIGVPMYNFNIPTTLSSYFSYILRAKVTFNFTPEGPVGLLPSGKKVILCFGMAGTYGEDEKPFTAFRDFTKNKAEMNVIEVIMKMNCAFIGLDNIYTVTAEGTAFDSKEKTLKHNSGLGRENAIKRAEEEIIKIVSEF